MKTQQLLSLCLGAGVALGTLADASAAERLAKVVQRWPTIEPPAGANSAKTFRLAGTVVDAEGKPVAGAVVECYQWDNPRAPLGGAETEAKERITTDATGAFDFRLSSV